MGSFEAELALLIAEWLKRGDNPRAMLLAMDDGKGVIRDHIKLAAALDGNGSPEAEREG